MNEQEKRKNDILTQDAWLAAKQAMTRVEHLFTDAPMEPIGVQGAGEITDHIIGILNIAIAQITYVRESLKSANGGEPDDDIPF